MKFTFWQNVGATTITFVIMTILTVGVAAIATGLLLAILFALNNPVKAIILFAIYWVASNGWKLWKDFKDERPF